MAANQQWFKDVHPWVDIQFARGGLFSFDRALSGEQRAVVAVTGVIWLRIPLVVGLGLVTEADVTYESAPPVDLALSRTDHFIQEGDAVTKTHDPGAHHVHEGDLESRVS